MKKIKILLMVLIMSFCSTTCFANEPTLKEMVGQMVMVGFRGLNAEHNSYIAKDISEAGIGGVILFSRDVNVKGSKRNIENKTQLIELIKQLKSYSKIPLFVAVDQEGGLVSRLNSKNGFQDFPSAQELGHKDNLCLTYNTGLKIAQMLSGVGFNLDFAPSADVNINKKNPVIGGLERSFSGSPDKVAAHAEAFICGLNAGGVLSSIKHFPGHGSSLTDTHKGFVNVSDTWTEDELYPFLYCIEKNKVDMVMTAHIFNSKLDEKYPATLSWKTITALLREKLGYTGVVVTDDMQMNAVSSLYSMKQRVKLAVLAGADILLFGNNLSYEPGLGSKVVQVLIDLVESKEIPEDRIKLSYDRIMKLKERI